LDTLNTGFEEVYTVEDYWDGPRIGVANYHGTPHHYSCVFDEVKDDWTNIYFLKPMDEETLRLVLERWQIWLRWRAAFHEGKVSLDSHPTLPEDEARYKDLVAILSSRLIVDPEKDIKAEGHFKRSSLNDGEQEFGSHQTIWKVMWQTP
jgi:hypothetical protein